MHRANRMMRGASRQLGTSVLATSAMLLTGSVSATDAQRLAVELNALKPAGSSCQMALLFTNQLEADVQALSLELVVFDGKGIMDRVLRVKSSDLPAGKMRLMLFNLEDLECASVGSILVNDMTGCQGPGLSAQVCAEAVSASHKTSVPFIR